MTNELPYPSQYKNGQKDDPSRWAIMVLLPHLYLYNAVAHPRNDPDHHKEQGRRQRKIIVHGKGN